MIDDAPAVVGANGSVRIQCPVCEHPARAEIELASYGLRRLPELIRQHGLTEHQIRSHAYHAIQIQPKRDISRREDTLRDLDEICETLKLKARVFSDPHDPRIEDYTALIREFTRAVTLVSKLSGDIKTGNTINILAVVKEFGLIDEESLRTALREHTESKALPFEDQVTVCERFLADAYRRRPDMASNSSLLRMALPAPEAEEVEDAASPLPEV